MTVDEYLAKLASRLKLGAESRRQYEASLNYLTSMLWAQFQEELEYVQVIGSFDRGTMLNTTVNSDPDVDVLIVFKENKFQPQTYLSKFQRFAEKYYSNSEVFQSHPTIAIEMHHVKFELIPSYLERGVFSNTLKIPAPRSTELKWKESDPSGFKSELKSKNRKNNEMISPLILLLKYWNLINGGLFSSYFFEEFCVLNRSYLDCTTISQYFYEIINDLNNSRSNYDEERSQIVAQLFERRRRLMVLEKNNMHDYVETEFSMFLPMT